jgi:hypothetical protein
MVTKCISITQFFGKLTQSWLSKFGLLLFIAVLWICIRICIILVTWICII